MVAMMVADVKAVVKAMELLLLLLLQQRKAQKYTTLRMPTTSLILL